MRTLSKSLVEQESSVFRRLNSPTKIQDYLDTLPINFEKDGETYMSPRRTIRTGIAHCFEGALLAAAALWYHGKKPLLLDLKTVDYDEDHVVALFRDPPAGGGLWGAISKTNHAILRYRDPVYRSVRELVMSYFHEYTLENRKKTLRSYSKPFDLSRYAPERWITAEEELHFLVEALDASRHFPIAPASVIKKLRRTSPTEVKILGITEWPKPKS